MRAWRIDRYGGPEVMDLVEAAVPTPGPGEVLVQVRAASVNPIDWKMRSGALRDVFRFSLPRILGRDFAGRAVAVGEGIDDLPAGTRVFGVGDPMRDGTHAEYVVVPRASLARTPNALPDDEAAAIPVSGVSALIPLAEAAALKPGQRVLVHAGSGGVGTFAVQIAHHLGAEVIATASGRNTDYVAQLGAARIIDYAARDFAAVARDCDIVFDTLGGEIHRRSFACLKPGGVLVALNAAPVIGLPPPNDVRVLWPRIQCTDARLSQLAAWAVDRTVVPQIGARFPFHSAAAAYALSESGHARGKIILLAE
jgi:NADPH:quinone reductase-like Zn-dependent oxidoreductase